MSPNTACDTTHKNSGYNILGLTNVLKNNCNCYFIKSLRCYITPLSKKYFNYSSGLRINHQRWLIHSMFCSNPWQNQDTHSFLAFRQNPVWWIKPTGNAMRPSKQSESLHGDFSEQSVLKLPQQRMGDLELSVCLSVCSFGTPGFSFSATCLSCLGLTGSWGGFPGRKYVVWSSQVLPGLSAAQKLCAEFGYGRGSLRQNNWWNSRHIGATQSRRVIHSTLVSC